MKKGIVGQIFIYLTAALVFAFIFLFGYRAINEFLTKGEEVSLFDFKKEIESAVEEIYDEWQSVRIRNFYLPSKYQKVCFVQLDAQPVEGLAVISPKAYETWLLANETKNYDYENVFLIPEAEKVKIKTKPLEIDQGYLCVNLTKGKFSLRLEGKGDRAKISLPEK